MNSEIVSTLVVAIPSIIVGGISFLPFLIKIRKAIRDLREGVETFTEKYSGKLSGEVKEDFDSMIINPLDRVLERSADLLSKLKMKKSAKRLRKML